MRFVLIAIWFMLSLVVPAAAEKAVHPEPTASISAVNVPNLAYRERTLANGLRVFTLRNVSTPNVAVQVFYGVGGKDDPIGQSGLAHLFEHMMFKRTRNMPSEMMDRLTEDVGGFNNAYTEPDYTQYYEVIPANHLERVLWAEADRMGGLLVEESSFVSERDVVKEEIRELLASPHNWFYYVLLPAASFTTHPYKRPAVGSIEELDAATMDDVRKFHATFYRPDNAALIVVGNFDEGQVQGWVDRYFGPIPRPATELPSVTAMEPSRSEPFRVARYGPNVPLPAVGISYLIPPANHQDSAALRVLDYIMSAGESSRLDQSLIYEQQLAQTAFSNADRRRQPGLFWLAAVMAEGKSVDEGERALLAEIEKVRVQPVSAEELSEAKAELAAELLRERETNEGTAEAIGEALMVEGDSARVNVALNELQAVTAADVQRVARRYLDPEKRVVVRFMDEAHAPTDQRATSELDGSLPVEAANPPSVPDKAAMSAGSEVAAPVRTSAQLPPIGPAVQVNISPPAERTLANGLRVIVASDHDLPLVTVLFVVRNGAEVDPEHLSGLASLTAALVTEGAGTRSASEIDKDVEQVGGTLDSWVNWDGSFVSLDALAPSIEPSTAILADVVMRPAFTQEEVDRVRRETLDSLTISLTQPSDLAWHVANSIVFQQLYDHPPNGTPDSLKRITRADLASLHRTWWVPENAAIIFAGDITPEHGFALAERMFGMWPRSAGPLPALESVLEAKVSSSRVLVVDLPASEQADVLLVKEVITRTDPLYPVAEVADSILGRGYSSRLNQEIRIKRGLSYGANSFLNLYRYSGLLGAELQTNNESVPEVLDLLISELNRLGDVPASEAELSSRKSVLVGELGRELEAGDEFGTLLGELTIHGLPLAELTRYLPAITSVTPEQVRAYADTWLLPDQSMIIVVGNAKAFVDLLRKKFKEVRTVPAVEAVEID